MKNLFILLFLVSATIYAQNDNWKKLAEKTVAYKNEKDKVTLTGAERDITKVKLKCTQGTLEVKSITIVMDNGEKKEYDAKGIGVMTKGMFSMPYDVPGKGEKVKHLELEYDTKGNILLNKRAKVEVWGKKGK